MKKIACMLAVVLCFVSYSKAQSDYLNYYYAEGMRHYWVTDSTSVNIIVDRAEHYDQIANNLSNIFNDPSDIVIRDPEDDNIIVFSRRLLNIPLGLLQNLISVSNTDIGFMSYSKVLNNNHLWLRNDIYIQLLDSLIYDDKLNAFLQNHQGIDVQYEGSGLYRVSSSSETTLLYIANSIYDSSFVRFATPDFYSETALLTSDPLYPYQWNLKNTYCQYDSVNGYDINVERAWEMLGFEAGLVTNNIRVAIIDDGVEPHEDMLDQNGNSRVIPGYTVNDNGTGYPVQTGAHGECCAGIIAASHNEKHIAGIAPNTIIIPIRIFKYKLFDYDLLFSAKKIANGIVKAYSDFNADILSCSWRHVPNDLIRHAIEKALLYGRNGKGCVVVASSGNGALESIEFPASIPGVISVGSINRNGYRSSFSNYGGSLSVVAPGDSIYTLDREGVLGCKEYNYNPLFIGTSAAAPHVAGVAALMLAVNQNLYSDHVKRIIETTANKIHDLDYYHYSIHSNHPNGTWNKYMGYGLVDAYESVKSALFCGPENYIIGSTVLTMCNDYFFELSGIVPNGCTIEWETSNYLHISSGQGTCTISVKPICQSYLNWIKLHFKYNNIIVKTISLDNIIVTGPPIPPVVSSDSSIISNIVWSEEKLLGYEISVDSGAVLTITNTIHCTDSARIIVNPGGKLVVDGGTLTSACTGEMWQGIEVVGDRNKRQLPEYQGTVELRNGARIENAHCAIRTGLGDDNWHTTGGIVKADNAFFVNNRRSVAFLSYTNHNAGGAIVNNQSYFHRCVFTVNDNNLFGQNNGTFIDHVTMWEVRGVKFRGCTFNNLTTGNTGDRRHGIYTVDAGFTVDTYCSDSFYSGCECPENEATYSTFSGFTTAVEVDNSGEQQPVYINSAQFENNTTGVRIDANNYATVTRCNFDLQNYPWTALNNTGLILDNSSGYKVEANHFERSSYSPNGHASLGVVVNNSGRRYNNLHLNDYTQLNFGISAQSCNGDSRDGLQFTCNTFTMCGIDFYVASGATVAQFICSQQAGADNVFERTMLSSLFNAGNQTIEYGYSTGSEHVPYNPTNFYVIDHLAINSCDSTLCGNGGEPGGGGQYLAGFQSDMNAFAAATSNQSPADGTDGGVNVTLSETARALSETYYNAVRGLLADTVLDLNELEQWHTVAQPIADPYSLTETRFMMGHSEPFVTDADDAELANYADFHAMKLALRAGNGDVDGTVEANDYSPLQQDGHINWYALTPAQIAQLQTIAERNAGRASVMAKGVLCFFFGICYDDELLVDDNADNNDNNGGAETRSAKAVQQNGETHLNVYPNPTDDILYVELSGTGIKSVGLYDLQGRIVADAANAGGRPAVTLNVRNVPAGVYVLRVTDENGKEYHRKVVVK